MAAVDLDYLAAFDDAVLALGTVEVDVVVGMLKRRRHDQNSVTRPRIGRCPSSNARSIS